MILHGDCLDVLRTLDEASIDACVTDPPYELGFMGKTWDSTGVAYDPETWRAVLRVLKPGAHLLAFGGTRTFHRMTCAIEDAGFEIRDCLSYLYGSGFPKSLNIGCKCWGNTVEYNHADNSVRGVRQGSNDASGLAETGQAADLFASLQRDSAGQGTGQTLAQGASGVDAGERGVVQRKDERREESGMEGRQLHRAGQGLSDDPDAEPSEGTPQRLRAGAHTGGGKDSRPSAEAGRGSASQGQGQNEQQPGKSASLRLPPRTLDGGASERRSRCEKCGGLTSARGLGTALKPCWEPVIVARKRFDGSVAANVLKHGTGALNIDECRLPAHGENFTRPVNHTGLHEGWDRPWRHDPAALERERLKRDESERKAAEMGRWPPNVLLDEIAAAQLDQMTEDLKSGGSLADCEPIEQQRNVSFAMRRIGGFTSRGDSGGASRFFYCAKPSREERDYGCYGLPAKTGGEATDRKDGLNSPRAGAGRNGGSRNHHATVKPVELMRWLVRLITPPGGTVLDPFLGSGTTGMACRYEHREFIGIEKEQEYIEIAKQRIAAVAPLFFTEEDTA